ncbi:transcription regulator [Actinidia rufa]|uniref:Transcription regulator n=1 Tax=Actinidia rufa TaxID=165716 RepID=A0A7J0DHR1_9ERIC|nr:transcription regulator [Actinidia rufa]
MLFAEWYRICELPGTNDAACAHYILQLQQSGLLKGDDISDRFFRCLTELSVSHCLSSEVISSGPLQSPQQVHPLSFLAIDIYAKLVFSILKVLAVSVRFIQKDAEERKVSFNARPYFRLFINWLLDLGSMDPVFDGANFQVLIAFANAFHALQPLKVPGFSFAWLELVSHRSFMPKLLTGNAQKGWPYMQRLLVDVFQFLEPFLRNAELEEPVYLFYLRVTFFFASHYYCSLLNLVSFCFKPATVSAMSFLRSCIQMRNIILSAFPRNMRLPDPSTPNLKIDLLAEISQPPRILSEVDAALKAKLIKGDLDEYQKTRQQGSSFLTELKQKLLLPPGDAARAGTRYNVPLINSLVLYVGMQAIQQLQARTPPHAQSMASSVPLAAFFRGGWLVFGIVLVYHLGLCFELLLAYRIEKGLNSGIELRMPNPRYNFWSRSFTRCAPEIEKLFESVSRSCGGPKSVDESVVAGGISDNMH